MRNYTFFKSIFDEVSFKFIVLDISIPAVKKRKTSLMLDKN
jgi:hypothetical protein